MKKSSGIKNSRLFKAAAAAALLSCTLLFSACESLKGIVSEPLLSLRSVDMAGIDFNGVDLLCKLDVQNPNAFDIPLPEISWNLNINTNDFVNGLIKSNSSLKSRKSSIVEIPVRLSYVEIFKTFASLKGSTETDYRIDLGVKIPFPLFADKTWNFSHAGTVPVLQIPKFTAPSFKIGRLNFTGAELVCSVNVENPNNFELPFPDMDYDFGINGNSFLKSSVVMGAGLAAAAVSPVDIKLQLNYADLYKTFQSLKNSSEANCLLALKSKFAIPAFSEESSSLDIAGKLPMLKAPSLSFKGIDVKNISLSKLDFEVGLEVENNNSFAMNINDFNYNLKVNNAEWGSGRVLNSPALAPGKKTVVPINLSLSSLSMVTELTNIIARGTDVAYAVGGNMDLSGNIAGLEPLKLPFAFDGKTKIKK
jgi:LEA14-like dessication related protein